VLFFNCGKRAPVGTMVSIRRRKCIRIFFAWLTFEKNTMSDETAWSEKMFGVKWKWRSVSTAVAGWFFCKLRRHEIEDFEQNIASQTLVRHERPWSGILYRTRIVRAYDYPKSKILNKISLRRRCERPWSGILYRTRFVRAYDYPKQKQRQNNVTI
jgi:hypothetical protein